MKRLHHFLPTCLLAACLSTSLAAAASLTQGNPLGEQAVTLSAAVSPAMSTPVVAPVWSGAALPGPGPILDLDFAALAKQGLERHQLADRTSDNFDFGDYCQAGFVHLDVGLYDLYMERTSFTDSDDALRMLKVGASLASMQAAWLNWVDPQGEVAAGQLKVAKELAAYLKKASVKGAVAAAEASVSGGDQFSASPGALDLWTVLDTKKAALGRFREFATFMQTSGGLGLERDPKREPMVLYPDRAGYVEVIAVAGWARPEAQDRMWNENVFTWTNFYVNEWRFVAMAFSPANPTEGNYHESNPMENRMATALEQQLCQLGALGLLDNYFGGRIPPAVAGGLSLNLVIEVFNEVNTRVDGDLRERRKEAREMFVPGGQSEGGVLPPNMADSRWREGHGKDHFIGVLKAAQKAGKEATKRKGKDKVRYFQLEADDEVEKMVLAAPVLGNKNSQLGSVPMQFYGDRLEFARSYSSCFLYWMREKAGGKKPAASHATFAALLQELAKNKALDPGGILESDPTDTFTGLFDKHYGMPLSDETLNPKVCLEGGFLNWLPKAR